MLDLFSGIGGFALGLERAGMETVAFCEIEKFPRRVLRKHWPNVPILEDIKNVTGSFIQKNIGRVDLISGGFPCQDVSSANPSGKGINGERSGLWKEYHRIICEIRPSFVIVENVSNLLNRGMGVVLRDLATSGYDAQWRVFSACELGLPHTRERVFITAYPHEIRSLSFGLGYCKAIDKWLRLSTVRRTNWLQLKMDNIGTIPDDIGTQEEGEFISTICGKDDGVPSWMDRCGTLGSAIVPVIAEIIGRSILDARNVESNKSFL